MHWGIPPSVVPSLSIVVGLMLVCIMIMMNILYMKVKRGNVLCFFTD